MFLQDLDNENKNSLENLTDNENEEPGNSSPESFDKDSKSESRRHSLNENMMKVDKTTLDWMTKQNLKASSENNLDMRGVNEVNKKYKKLRRAVFKKTKLSSELPFLREHSLIAEETSENLEEGRHTNTTSNMNLTSMYGTNSHENILEVSLSPVNLSGVSGDYKYSSTRDSSFSLEVHPFRTFYCFIT